MDLLPAAENPLQAQTSAARFPPPQAGGEGGVRTRSPSRPPRSAGPGCARGSRSGDAAGRPGQRADPPAARGGSWGRPGGHVPGPGRRPGPRGLRRPPRENRPGSAQGLHAGSGGQGPRSQDPLSARGRRLTAGAAGGDAGHPPSGGRDGAKAPPTHSHARWRRR